MHFTDILNAIERVQSFLGSANFERYVADDYMRSAVERQVEILSEAAHRLGDEAETLCPGPDWPSLRGLGNVLRHEYHKIIDQQVWFVIETKLPTLKQDVTAALERYNGTTPP